MVLLEAIQYSPQSLLLAVGMVAKTQLPVVTVDQVAVAVAAVGLEQPEAETPHPHLQAKEVMADQLPVAVEQTRDMVALAVEGLVRLVVANQTPVVPQEVAALVLHHLFPVRL